MTTKTGLAAFLLTVGSLSLASAPILADSWTVEELAAALDASSRSEADRKRDADRKPAEVVVLAGIEPGMTVIDLMAASGWYTEVLSVAAGFEGTVYAQNPPSMLEFRDGFNDKRLTERLADDRLPNVERVDGALADLNLKPGSFDVAFTALNFHDTYNYGGTEAATAQIEAIHDLLKPGGVLLLIDHQGDPEGDNVKLHRIDKEITVDIVTGVGFEVEADSDLLAHPEDDRTQMVFGKIRGKTDRFVLKLRKAS